MCILSSLDVKTYFFNYEMTLDSPPHKVWPHMLDYTGWNPGHIGAQLERLAGTRNEEGEIILEYKKSGDGYAPPIIIETVKMIPNEKIVWALYDPHSGATNGIVFVDFSLQEVNGKTKFTYHSYGWGAGSAIGEDMSAFRNSVMEAVGKQLPALKSYVEAAK